MASNKKALIVGAETDPERGNVVAKILGSFTLIGFVLVWLLSIVSPFFFVVSIVYGYYAVAFFIFLVTTAAYTPWRRGVISRSVKRFYSVYAHQYFKKYKVVFEGTKPSAEDPQTFYAVHPHGAYCMGWSMLYCSEVMEHVRFCFAPALFASPFFRLFSRWTGKPGSAAKFSMLSYLKKGEHLALPPGGFEEATLTSLNHDRAFIKKRTGFVKLCLKHGTAIRPIYVFGEKSCYWNIQGAFKTRLAMNRYGLPAIFALGNPILPILPRWDTDLYIAMGEPILVPKIDNPSKEQVSQWHKKYMAALTKLFEDHKEEAYGPDAKTIKLELW